jgi:GDP-4-dehydro-6-deoxy-D-mannose reductase
MIARPFNHIGPRQAPHFAVSNFAQQIAEIGAGKRPPKLTVGNIDVTRDFTDVFDVLKAYLAILAGGQNGETYNVCSGKEHSIRALLEILLSIANVKAEIEHDPTRNRPSDQPRVCGSFEKLRLHTGWHPSTPLAETLTNLYHYWENKIGK